MRLLLGGSPCTKWSIAQSSCRREVEPQGGGWDLFMNYVRSLERYRPDFFLYENNHSISQPIKDAISEKLGARHIMINSALVSAQNRKRCYWTNIPGVEQPEDLGILLRDVLDSGEAWREKAYTLDSNYYKTLGNQGFEKQSGRRKMVADAIPAKVLNVNPSGKGMNGTVIHTNGKSGCLTTNKGEGQKIIEPVCVAQRGRYSDTGNRSSKSSGTIEQHFEAREDGKTNALTTVQKDNAVAQPIRIAEIGASGGQGQRVYSPDGKAVAVRANGRMENVAEPVDYKQHNNSDIVITDNLMRCQRRDKKHSTIQSTHVTLPHGKTQTLSVAHIPKAFIEWHDGKTYPVYEVKDGLVTIKDKTYQIKLQDGCYIIRKLSVSECRRLQTIPEWYRMPCSNTQNYKMLGNGWTVDVT